MQRGFLSLPHFKLKFWQKFQVFCYRFTLWHSCRKPPVDGVPTLVECSSAPIEPDRLDGFEKLVENKWFSILKVVDEYCSRELVVANANKRWWGPILHCT